MAVEPRSSYLYVPDAHASLPGGTPSFSVKLPDYEGTDAIRGWTPAGVGAPQRPIHLTMRHVMGRSTTGAARKAIVASIDADLWTGAALSFSVNTVTYNVTGYVGEARTNS